MKKAINTIKNREINKIGFLGYKMNRTKNV